MPRRRTLVAAFIAVALLSAIGWYRNDLRTLARDIKYSPTRPTPQLGANAPRFNAQHQRILDVKSQGPFEVIFLGDSITEFWLEPLHQPIWQQHFGDLRAANFGVSSDATQNVFWRITKGGEFDALAPPRLIVLMIGTNNTPTNSARAIARGVETVVRTIQSRFPSTTILLLSILPRERGGDAINAKIRATNARIARLHDGGSIHYLDVTPTFLDSEGKPAHEMLADGLHLSVFGYEQLGRSIRPEIDRLLRN